MKMSDRPNTKNPRVSGLTNVKGNPLKKQLQMTTSQRKSKERFDVGSKERKREEKNCVLWKRRRMGKNGSLDTVLKCFSFYLCTCVSNYTMQDVTLSAVVHGEGDLQQVYTQ